MMRIGHGQDVKPTPRREVEEVLQPTWFRTENGLTISYGKEGGINLIAYMLSVRFKT